MIFKYMFELEVIVSWFLIFGLDLRKCFTCLLYFLVPVSAYARIFYRSGNLSFRPFTNPLVWTHVCDQFYAGHFPVSPSGRPGVFTN